MSGHWPPEWGDPEEEFPDEADQLEATVLASEGEARLSEVAAFLASVPAPALPDAVEARISAALAAEAATRADNAAPADGSREAGRSRTPTRAGRHRGSGPPRRRSRLRPAVAAGSLVACLLLAGLGYALSRTSTQSSTESSAASSAGSASSAAAGSAARPGAVPGPRRPAEEGSRFAVTASGTKYRQATLAEQVRARLAVSAASATPASAAPSLALQGCVLNLTNGAVPRLVDRAAYQGQPAYVIASSSHVWVVGPGCTAAKTELVASVPLAGLPGNLRALISVEQQAFTGRRVQ
jgi:hypothetical protein